MIYFIQSGHRGPIKIGYTNRKELDFYKRLNLLQVGNPKELKVLGFMEGGRAEESELHKVFSSDRIGGEWFSPCPLLIDYIKPYAIPKKSESYRWFRGRDMIEARIEYVPREKVLIWKEQPGGQWKGWNRRYAGKIAGPNGKIRLLGRMFSTGDIINILTYNGRKSPVHSPPSVEIVQPPKKIKADNFQSEIISASMAYQAEQW